MKCELCGRTEESVPETRSDHLRWCYLIRRAGLEDAGDVLGLFDKGGYIPRSIGIDEVLALHGSGEHIICGNRRKCNERYRKHLKRTRETKPNA